jgi:predicted N-acetyltransferase YhbS
MSVVISDLRLQRRFSGAVADRVWRAWWKDRGIPLSELAAWVEQSLSASAMPFALVAHDGDEFAGTASVIAADLADRPHYSPWVAAVWVEPDFRHRRLGHALVAHAAAAAFALGYDPVYLCAREALHGFYAGQGWKAIERGVGERRMSVFTLRPPAAAPARSP